ncbi:hypothetical protein JTB14_029685 [Gonioctena quinquepunctata]|nr:hypothetical protein JTB14_029685 [Gonioctena quinquepunctata]
MQTESRDCYLVGKNQGQEKKEEPVGSHLQKACVDLPTEHLRLFFTDLLLSQPTFKTLDLQKREGDKPELARESLKVGLKWRQEKEKGT